MDFGKFKNRIFTKADSKLKTSFESALVIFKFNNQLTYNNTARMENLPIMKDKKMFFQVSLLALIPSLMTMLLYIIFGYRLITYFQQ